MADFKMYNFEIFETLLNISLLISDLVLCGHEIYSKISDEFYWCELKVLEFYFTLANILCTLEKNMQIPVVFTVLDDILWKLDHKGCKWY